MANFSFTANMKLKAIEEFNEQWFTEWIYTFNRIDSHNHTTNKGVQIPTGGIQDGAITKDKLAMKFYESSWLVLTNITTFAHNLTAIPNIVQLYYDDNGTVVIYGDGSHIVEVTTSNIVLDFSGLTIDATHKLKINAIKF